MTRSNESEASPDAGSSAFGLPGGASGTDSDVVLCESHRNGPSCPSNGSVGVKDPRDTGRPRRGVQRLGIVIVMLVLGLLLDSRRLVEAASLLLL